MAAMRTASSDNYKRLSKEEMHRRRRDKLCFECGLLGHHASSHGKGIKPSGAKYKQLKTTRRGGYDTSQRVITESQLEDPQMSPQVVYEDDSLSSSTMSGDDTYPGGLTERGWQTPGSGGQQPATD